jgi:hypothetical protein
MLAMVVLVISRRYVTDFEGDNALDQNFGC